MILNDKCLKKFEAAGFKEKFTESETAACQKHTKLSRKKIGFNR